MDLHQGLHVPFSISARPNTDAWKLPPAHNVYNAPQHFLAKQPLTDFHNVSVTFTGNYIHQYDQAGLLLTMTKKGREPKWIKTGIEFYEGSPRLSTVCTDNWSDSSVAPAPSPKDIQTGKKQVTIQVEKEVGDDGSLYLWVNYLDELEKKTQLRQIGWVFGENGGKGWDMNLAAVAARPEQKTHDSFHSKFSAVNVNGKKYTSK